MGPKIQQYFVRYKRVFVITVIVITEFDCSLHSCSVHTVGSSSVHSSSVVLVVAVAFVIMQTFCLCILPQIGKSTSVFVVVELVVAVIGVVVVVVVLVISVLFEYLCCNRYVIS